MRFYPFPTSFLIVRRPLEESVVNSYPLLQIVHRTLAAMLGALAALAALAIVGEVSYQTVCAPFVSGCGVRCH